MDDSLQILRPNAARVGSRRVRIYACPGWVRPDGRTWTAIEDAVRVAESGGGYRIGYQGQSIEFLPHVSDAASLLLARKANRLGRHFGPVLHADLAPDVLRWKVMAGPGVKRTGDAWILGEPDGVKLGLFLCEWRQRFGKDCTIEGDDITLDLRKSKAVALQPHIGAGEIDLDPPSVDPVSNGICDYEGAHISGGWSNTRNLVSAGVFNLDKAVVKTWYIYVPEVGAFAEIWRTALRFELPDLTPASATLKLTRDGSPTGSPGVTVSTPKAGFDYSGDPATLYHASNYEDIRITDMADEQGDMDGTDDPTWTFDVLGLWSAGTTVMRNS